MKTLKSLSMLFFATVLSFNFVSCGDDDAPQQSLLPEEAKPFVGYWRYLSHAEEYCEMLSFTENGFYQIRSQKGDRNTGVTPFNGGTFAYDKNNSQLHFMPGSASDVKGEFDYKVISITAEKLVVVNNVGHQLSFEKVSDSTFPYLPHWGNPWYVGTWKSEFYCDEDLGVNDLYDQYTFKNDGTCERVWYLSGEQRTTHYISYSFTDTSLTLVYEGKSNGYYQIKSHTDNTLTIEEDGKDKIFTRQ